MMKRLTAVMMGIVIVLVMLVVGTGCTPLDKATSSPTPNNLSLTPPPQESSTIQPCSDPSLADRVIELARGQVGRKEGNGTFAGLVWADANWTYCERFVERIVATAMGRSFWRFDNATADYEAHSNLINDSTPIPRGAIVYYGKAEINGNCGHVGISDGSGKLISVLTKERGVEPTSFDAAGAPLLGWICPEEYYTIQYGHEVTGTITKSGGYEDWRFTGQAGDIITIHMVQSSGASLSPMVELFDPSGKWVAQGFGDNGYTEAWIKNYTLRFSGTYSIRAEAAPGVITTGGYKLSLSKN
jgi:hypothetical protein